MESLLTGLGASVADRLSDEQRTWYAEFVGVGEYGLALEMLADWLSEDNSPVSSSERTEIKALASAMGIEDRVMGPLDVCPSTE